MSSSTDVDQFEQELGKFDVHSSTDVAALGQHLGLDGGGSWWLNTYETAVEFDSNGHLVEGAVAEVESQVRAWLRHSFDNNPEFRDNSYHLLGRLNELARLQGLVEEVALKYHNSERERKNASCSSSYSEHRDLGRSHLSDDLAHLHQDGKHGSGASSENYFSCDTFTKRTLEAPSFKRPPLPEAYQDVHRADDQLYPKNPALSRQFVKPSGLPYLHKSQQPPSPHHQSQRNHLYGRRASVHTPNAFPLTSTSTDSPDSLQVHSEYTGVLNRTYSKEALDQLKASDIPPGRRSGGSLLDNFLRTSNHSGAGSDPEGVVDVAKSFDSVGFATNILSKSLTDGEIFSLRASGVKTNASFSSIRSSNILEMALFQESQLRKLSGSRGKLSGSNSSLAGSSVDTDGFLHPTNLIINSTDYSTTGDADFAVNSYKGIALRRSPQPKRASPLNLRGLHPFSTQDPTKESEHQNLPKHIGLLPDNLAASPSMLTSEPPTPVVAATPEPISTKKDQRNTADPTTATYRHQHSFFPEVSPADEFHQNKQTDRESELNRLSSFEQMEARVSQEYLMSGTRTSPLDYHTANRDVVPKTEHLCASVASVSSTRHPGGVAVSDTVTRENYKKFVPRTSVKNESRPQTKIPAYSTHGTASVRAATNPAPSKQLPTLSVRSQSSSGKPSSHSSVLGSSASQVRVQSQQRNPATRSAASLMHRSDVRPPFSRPSGIIHSVTGTAGQSTGTTSSLSIPQPKASRSSVSPVRSRRFGRGASVASGTRRS